MSHGLLATDIAAAHDLAGRLRGVAAVLGAPAVAPTSSDMVFASAASAIGRVTSEATRWRSTSHDVVRALAAGIDVAADDPAPADGR